MRLRRIGNKIKTIFAAGILCLSVTACGAAGDLQNTANGSQSAEAEAMPVGTSSDTLEIWTFYDRNVPGYYYMFLWDDIAEEYGISVEVKNYSSDEMESRLSPALVTGELPDIFLTEGGTYLDDFVEAGVCAPVNRYLKDVELADGYNSPYQGETRYVIPCMLNDYGVAYYDAWLLEKMDLEIPRSWEDLENMVRAVNAYNQSNGTDYAAISFGEKDGNEGNLLLDIISACEDAKEVNTTSEQRPISDETFRVMAEKVERLISLGAFSEDYMETGDEEAVTNFINHKSVMLVNHSSLLSHLTWNMGEDFYTAPFPGTYTERGNYSIVRLNGDAPAGLCINASCSDKDLAGMLCVEYLKRVNEENVRLGCKSMLADTEEKAERLTQRQLELNSLIDSASLVVNAPSSFLTQEQKNELKALSKDLYGERSDLEGFLEAAKSTFRQ